MRDLYLTISAAKELYKMAGRSITERAILSGIKRGKFPSAQRVNHNKVGRGGWIWKIHVSDLPPEIQAKYYETQLNDKEGDSGNGLPETPTEADGGKALIPTEPSAPMSFPETHSCFLFSAPQEQGLQGNSPAPGNHSQQGQGYLFPAPDSFPEKAKKIGLARLDLINAWREHRKDHKKKEDVDKEFIDIYNNNIFYKNLYDILGGSSIKTLYKWNKELNGTQDWRRLIPLNYKKNEGLNEAERKAFLGILLRPNKFRIGTAITMTKVYLKKKDVPSDKSDRTFRRFAERFKAKNYDQWILAREGQKALKDKVGPYIQRDLSSLKVGEAFIADGHRLNFQIINPFTGKPCRAVLVGYLDWKSWDLAGYEIMLEEDTQCILSALRSSIIRLRKIPEVAYQDNGKAFKARFFTSTESFEESGFYGLFGRLGITPIFAQPYNARAKPIERWFKEFTNTFERFVPSFVGSSIGDKPAWMLQGEKFHKALHREYIPTIEETIQLIEKWLEWYRSRPCPHIEGKTIGQAFNEGRGPGIDINQLDDLMMAIEIKKVGRNGIRFLHSDYYDEALYGLQENVLMRYCRFDLSYVKVYSMNNEFLCIANRRQPVHPLANYSGSPRDVEELKWQRSQQRKLENKTIQGVKGLMKMGRPIEIEWEKVTAIAPRITDKLEKEPLSRPDSFRTTQEAMKEFMSYFPGIFFSPEERELIGNTIWENDLEKNFVEKLALKTRAQLTIRDSIDTPIEVDKSITQKSIPFIEFLKRLIQEVGPISKELNQRLRAEHGDSIESSKAEEVIQKLGSLPGPENPENHSPVFQYGWQRYEFLNNKQSITEEERQWIKDYEEGRILPGEYEEIYIKLRQQNVFENNQCLSKREAL